MKIFRYITALALSAMMAGCASDGFDSPGKGTDGMTEVTLRLPSPEGASNFARTRGEDPAPNSPSTSEEGKIVDGDLWLFAFPTSGSEENTLRTKLNPSDISMTNEYRDFKVKLIPDGYHFYVIANLKRFAGNQDFSSISEEALRALVLNFDGNGQELSTAKGLPMACLNTEIDEASEGVVDCSDGVAKTIHADLTFMCAKVRYTLLFDATDDGFSNAAFGSNTLDFSGVKTGNLVKQTKWVSPAAPSSTSDLFDSEASIGKCLYPASGLLGQYLSSTISQTGDAAPENLAAVTTHPSATQRAWQGVVYLPENLSEEDATRTTLTFTGSINGSSETEYPLPLVPAKAGTDGNLSPMERGHFYDLVGRITTSDLLSLTVRVADWTTQTLTYSLHGPYELHVDKTVIPLSSGKKTAIWYESDSEVEMESPKYVQDGKEYDLYILDNKTYPDSLVISVNPAVKPSASLTEEQLKSYNFFHLKAGNLRKRIDVVPLSLDPYLTVTPQEITLGVRELIESGLYEGDFNISVETNLSDVSYSWTSGWNDESNSVLKIIPGELKNGLRTDKLHFEGVNSGLPFWQKETTLTLTYTGTTSGGQQLPPQIVNVHIIPNVDDYIIHFRAKDWTDPHIYVYQCLELPSNSIHPNAPVSADADGNTAALEYSFTGKISFKGWNVGNFNNPDQFTSSGSDYKQGFYVSNSAPDSWSASNAEFSRHYYDNLDFCIDYRNTVSCSKCNSSEYNKLWPGIKMEKDGDWWTFRLSGVATPGKALIMFANGHKDVSNKSTQRYPGDNEVGIPLFDYPSREGWFDFDGDLQFHSYEPAVSPTQTYMLKWENSKTGDGNMDYWYVYIEDADTHIPYQNMRSNGRKYDSYNETYNYYTYTFRTTANWTPTRINVVLIDGGNKTNRSKPITLELSNFGNNEYLIKKDAIQQSPLGDRTYRIYWKYTDSFTGINLWSNNGIWGNQNFNNSDNPMEAGKGTYYKASNGYCYLEFVTNVTETTTFYYQHMPSYNYQGSMQLNKFSLVDGIYHYTLYPGEGGNSGKPSDL